MTATYYATYVAFLAFFAFKATMQNPFLKRLEALADLSIADRRKIDEIVSDAHQFNARERVVRRRECPDHAFVMLSGWASRWETLAAGKKQITAFLLPGDLCKQNLGSFGAADQTIIANISCCVAFVDNKSMTALFDSPAIARALWLSSTAHEEIMRAWLINIGAHDGLTRTAHLLCEIYARLSAIGMAEKGAFRLPLTQAEFGQALGLTAVHVNRMLRQLSFRGMINVSRGNVRITDHDALRALCAFKADYLPCTQ